MKTKLSKYLSLLLAVLFVLTSLPLTVLAACSHTYTKVYQSENVDMHSYKSKCTKCGEIKTGSGYSGWQNHNYVSSNTCSNCGYTKTCQHTSTTTVYNYENGNQHSYYKTCNSCGKKLTGTGYSGWSNHSFSGNTCSQCGYTKTCAHTTQTTTYSNTSETQHTVSSSCDDCGYAFRASTESHSFTYTYTKTSDLKHRVSKSCKCGASGTSTESHTFSNNTCTGCAFTKPAAVTASVSLSASSSSGMLGSAGGEIASESVPASYTVTAKATGCSVTKITYVKDGTRYTASGSSVTITASDEKDFATITFTAYTDVSGVTATFTVNHKYVKKGLANIMWETTNDATIRSITGNGLQKNLSHSVTIPTSYNGQSNLSDSAVNTLQSLIGKSDGKTYTVGYTRIIRVYTPAELSSTGQKEYRATYDGNNSSDISTCLSTWGWTEPTKEAIRQAASSALSFTTGLPVNCTAKWVDTSTGKTLYRKSFGSGVVYTFRSAAVSVAYSEYADAAKYEYENLSYSGTTSGTSTSKSYSETYTTTSKPLTVTFYCHPTVESGSVTVRAVDADTNALIPTATVSCGNETGMANPHTFTDLLFAAYKVSASAAGYDSAESSVTITADSTDKTVTLKLKKQLGTITVNVRDASTKQAIKGASVSGAGTSGSTNDLGTVVFSDVSFGTYSFTASATGYHSGSGSATITADAKNATVTIDLVKIPTTGSITVCVKDKATNAVISGASVSGGSYSGTTNSIGTVTFSAVPFGKYTFTASASGYYSASGTVEISLSAMNASITIYLTPIPTHGDITITVKDIDTGAAIAGAAVTTTGLSKTTDANGVTTFSSLSFGTYTFSASAADYVPSTGSATISTSKTTASITIYLERLKTDLSVRAFCNGDIYKGSTIIVTAEIGNHGTVDFTPTKAVTLTMTAARNDGAVFDTQTTSVIVPKEDKNLAWFALDTPQSGYTATDLTFTFTVTAPKGVKETNTADNTFVLTKPIRTLPTRSCKDNGFETTPPASFSYSRYNGKTAPTLSWSLYEWNGGFVKLKYTAALDLNAALTPDANAGYRILKNGIWTTRSGYGLETAVSATVVSSSTSIAGTLKLDTFYPEHNYATTEQKTDRLYNNGGSFVFPVNATSVNYARIHGVPLWFPNGAYAVKYYAFDVWCPAGMLTGYTNAYVNIDGDMYDDLYTN